MLRQFFSLFIPRLHWHRCRGLERRAVTAFSQWLRAPGPSFTLPPPATHCRSVLKRGLHASSLEHESPAVRQSHLPPNTSRGTPAHRSFTGHIDFSFIRQRQTERLFQLKRNSFVYNKRLNSFGNISTTGWQKIGLPKMWIIWQNYSKYTMKPFYYICCDTKQDLSVFMLSYILNYCMIITLFIQILICLTLVIFITSDNNQIKIYT